MSSYLTPQPKHHVSHGEWSSRLAEVKVTKSQLNALVLDYLVVEGYRDAAEEFLRETTVRAGSLVGGSSDGAESSDDDDDDDDDMAGGGSSLRDSTLTDASRATLDLSAIEERMLIRQALEAGQVNLAIRHINELDAEILDQNPTLYFHLQLLRFLELVRPPSSSSAPSNANPQQALLFATSTLAPLAIPHPALLAELELALTLLAFPPPGPYPSAEIEDLLAPAHRVRVGKEANQVLLAREGRGVESKLGGMMRILGWGEGRLEEAGWAVPRVEGVWRDDKDGSAMDTAGSAA